MWYYKGSIYLYGGCQGKQVYFSGLYSYNIENNQWKVVETKGNIGLKYNPLVEKSKKFALDVMGFAKEMEDRAASEETQKAIYDLCWYAGLLSAKLHRCLSGKYEAIEEDDPELKELDIEDARKTASVVAMAIGKCKKALDSLLLEHLIEIQKFYTELRDIEKGFRAEFPEMAVAGEKQLH